MILNGSQKYSRIKSTRSCPRGLESSSASIERPKILQELCVTEVTDWNRIPYLVKKSPKTCKTLPLGPVLSRINPVHVLPTNLRAGIPSGLFPSSFSQSIRHERVFSSRRTTTPRPRHCSLFEHQITQVLFEQLPESQCVQLEFC
jgi:hypothetical protein